MACLTNANAEYYQNTYGIKFRHSAMVITLLTALVSNVGLETIIEVSLPAILILCPIAIALIIATIALGNNQAKSVSLRTNSYCDCCCFVWFS